MLTWLCLIATLLLTLASQVSQKRLSLRFVARAAADTPDNVLRFYITAPLFWFALIALALGLACWILVLDAWAVGTAYPLLSINFILMQAASRYFFNEPLSWRQVAGVVLILLGVALVSGAAST